MKHLSLEKIRNNGQGSSKFSNWAKAAEYVCFEVRASCTFPFGFEQRVATNRAAATSSGFFSLVGTVQVESEEKGAKQGETLQRKPCAESCSNKGSYLQLLAASGKRKD